LKTEFKEGKLVLVGVNKYENKTEVVRSSEFVVQSKDTGTKTLVKPIKPIRIAEELEKQRSSTNSELPTSN
jgi:methylmalonyl-CoA mutase N-terminal domain/subunit